VVGLKLIAGLGNPGVRYASTRHNVGFMVLDRIAEKIDASFDKKEGDALYTVARYKGQKILLLKPQSFMNLSGFPLVALANFYKIDDSDILVIYDDLDLPPALMRLRASGSSGGHKGMLSIIEQIGKEQIARLKIGIGRSPYPEAADYVLEAFSREEMEVFSPAFDLAAQAALCWAQEGITEAMNRYNSAVNND